MLTPTTRAAMMNSDSRSASIWPRTSRHAPGHPSRPMTATTLNRLGPIAATNTMTRSSVGMLISVSTARMITKSIRPPTQPGEPAEDRADHDVDRDRAEADHERRPRPVDDPRPDVAPGAVRAEEVLGARWLADGLDVGEERPARDDVREDGQEHDDRQEDDARRRPAGGA